MIFTIGFILFIIAAAYTQTDDLYLYSDNSRIISVIGVIGILMMLFSLLKFTWYHLP